MVIMAVAIAAAASVISGCGSEAESLPETDDVVAQVGDSVITLTDVVRRIPRGLAPADSAALFNSIVDGWLERMLLDELAKENIDDLDRIEKMADDYRRKLIVASYRRSLRNSHRWSVPDDSVRRYYTDHFPTLKLDRPVVKGLYVKLPSDASRLQDIRRWMIIATPDAIDNLERYGLRDAVEYSFFEDNWTDWNLIAGQIPYRFDDPDSFVKAHKNFETTYGGMTYLLHISGYMQSGESMPYEVAAPLIAEHLERESGETYERRLIGSLYVRARKEGRLRDYRRPDTTAARPAPASPPGLRQKP